MPDTPRKTKVASSKSKKKDANTSDTVVDGSATKAAVVPKDGASGNVVVVSPDIIQPENGIYQAEAIVGRRVVRGKTQYKVKWFGYPDEDCTWEPLSNIGHCREFIEAFNQRTREENSAKRKSAETDLETGETPSEIQRVSPATSGKKRPSSIRSSSVKDSTQSLKVESDITDDANASVPEPSAKDKPQLRDRSSGARSPPASVVSVGANVPVSPKKINRCDVCVGTEPVARDTSSAVASQKFIPLASLLCIDLGSQPDRPVSGPNPTTAREIAYRQECLAELKRAAPRAVRVIGVTCKVGKDGTTTKEPYAVIHFRPAAPLAKFLSAQASIMDSILRQHVLTVPDVPAAETEYIQAYSIRHVRQVMPDKLAAYYQSLASILF